jgi:hypothetical protein
VIAAGREGVALSSGWDPLNKCCGIPCVFIDFFLILLSRAHTELTGSSEISRFHAVKIWIVVYHVTITCSRRSQNTLI